MSFCGLWLPVISPWKEPPLSVMPFCELSFPALFSRESPAASGGGETGMASLPPGPWAVFRSVLDISILLRAIRKCLKVTVSVLF